MATLARATQLYHDAGKIAARMAGSATLTEHIETAIRVARENKITVNNIHFDLFGTPNGNFEDGIFSEADYALLPVVGSEEGKTGNLPFDYCEFKNSAGVMEDRYFWRSVAEQHLVGAEYITKAKAIADREKTRNQYTDWEEADADRELKDTRADFGTFYSKLKLAVQAFHMMKEVGEKLADQVAVDYFQVPRLDKQGKQVKDAKGVVIYDLAESAQIIEVKNAADPRNPARKFFTLANFVRLNVELTLAGEGNYAAFITSNKRGEDEPELDETKHIKIENNKDFEDGMIAALHFINGIKAKSSSLKEAVKYISADDGRVQTLYALEDALAIFTGIPELKKRNDALGTGTDTPKEAAAKVAA